MYEDLYNIITSLIRLSEIYPFQAYFHRVGLEMSNNSHVYFSAIFFKYQYIHASKSDFLLLLKFDNYNSYLALMVDDKNALA